MRRLVWVFLASLAGGSAVAATDFIAPGTPSTIGRSGSVVGSTPGQAIPAPRGSMSTFGLQDGQTPGAAGYSEADAKSRIEAAGFTQVTGLTKGANGMWNGRGMKAGKSVAVDCDAMGHVSTL